MSYWKTKVLPKIKKYFDKPGKKAAAAEACKSFEDTKESIEKELEEKKEELQPKIVEVYKPLDKETKAIVKQPTDAAIKKHANAVKKLLEELSKIGFPGAAPASEAAAKYGPALVLGPVTYVFQKTSMFIIDEAEEAPPVAAEVAAAQPKPEEAAVEPREAAAAEGTTAEEGVVIEKLEKLEETVTDDGKIIETVQASETVTVPAPEPAKDTETVTVPTPEPAKATETVTVPAPEPAKATETVTVPAPEPAKA